MRDIRFRAWDANEKSFVYFGCVGGILAECDEPYIHNYIHLGAIMQYTGLKDKNGKEIYEGDILHYYFNTDVEWKTIVEWQYHIAGFFMSDGDFHEEHREVIGNIYENPDLLEGVCTEC